MCSATAAWLYHPFKNISRFKESWCQLPPQQGKSSFSFLFFFFKDLAGVLFEPLSPSVGWEERETYDCLSGHSALISPERFWNNSGPLSLDIILTPPQFFLLYFILFFCLLPIAQNAGLDVLIYFGVFVGFECIYFFGLFLYFCVTFVSSVLMYCATWPPLTKNKMHSLYRKWL